MPDTTNRPTPEQVLARASIAEVNGGENEPIGTIYKPEGVALVLLHALAEHGYVITHPADVPEQSIDGWVPTSPPGSGDRSSPSWLCGWNDCRAHIFGDTQ